MAYATCLELGWSVHSLQGRAVPDVDYLRVTLLEQNTNRYIASISLHYLVDFFLSVYSRLNLSQGSTYALRLVPR
jgi:hypothetical protein